MALQDQIEQVEDKICAADVTLRDAGSARQARLQLRGLKTTHKTLSEQVDELYAALDVGETFPDIRMLGLEFARTLVMAYDAKCIARQKVIGRFFEWDVLDRAAGGKGHALGAPLRHATVPCG